MYDFEEELKGRFKEAASTEGVDADQLWAGIAAELPGSPVPPPQKKRYRWLWLCLLLLIPLFWLLLSPQEEAQALSVSTEEMDSMAASPSPDSSSPQLPSLPSTKTSSATNAEPRQTEKVITPRSVDTATSANSTGEPSAQHSGQPTPARENPASPTSKPSTQVAEVPGSSAPVTSTMESPAAIKAPAIPQPGPPTTDLAQLTNNTRAGASEPLANPVDPPAGEMAFSPLATLGRKKIGLLTTSPELVWLAPAQRVERAKFNRWHWGAFAGLQFWSDTYAQQEDFGELLREATSSQPGYSVSLEVGYSLRPGLEVRSGVEYVQSYTQFNFVQTWDTVMFRPNVPDTEIIDALATRTVKHQNQQRLVSIPLMMGGHIQRGRIRIGVNAGLGLNWLVKQSGKSLNSQAVITSYGPEEGAYTTFFWSAQLQPYAQYQWTPGLAVQIRPSFRWQLHGKSAFHGLQHQSLLSGLSVGLVF